MKKLICSFLFVAGSLFFAACSSDSGNDDPGAQTPAPELKTPIEAGNDLYGIVIDNTGSPIEGVVVSDGFSCVESDANGVYQMARNKDAYHVFYRIPADRAVPIANGLPCFWQKLSTSQQRYDFTLSAQQAVEDRFMLFCVADPQVQTDSDISRFKQETIPDIKEHAATFNIPVYGVTLGDILFNTGTLNVFPTLMAQMGNAMHQNNTGIPLFQTMGNHDNSVKPTISEGSSNLDLAARREFESKFGPCDYSFDRGNAHIVCMDDILFTTESHNPSSYLQGFTDAQVEWLRQDLELVPKSKMVILCIHIPIRNGSANNITAVRDLLKGFAETHIMSGHTHYSQNYIDTGRNIYEHIHGAACGAWWKSTINKDGAPNGYGVYEINGSGISNWYYKATCYDRDFQIRMYRANTRFAYDDIQQFIYHNSDQIIANIWNSDNRNWSVEVYEDGAKTGNMTRYTDNDVWAVGYHAGVLGKTTYTGSFDHLYYYKLQDKDAAVEIRATDKFGNTYKQTMFTTNSQSDYPTVANYPKE